VNEKIKQLKFLEASLAELRECRELIIRMHEVQIEFKRVEIELQALGVLGGGD